MIFLSRLPKARIRVVVLFTVLVLICWMLDIAVWSVFAFLVGLGVVVVAFAQGDGGITLFLLGPAYLIREWAFDFPHFVLHPRSNQFSKYDSPEENGNLVGMIGITTSPLRPCGDADFNGQKISVIALEGTWIDCGTSVIVKVYKNGLPAVVPIASQ